MTEMHEVVTLLLARMESNPEEFERGMSRWAWMLESVMTSCSEKERAALHAGLRPIRLNQLHEDVMDELFNGPERRAQEEDMLNKTYNNNNMGASLSAAPHPTKKIVMTQAELSIIDKLTKSYTPAEKDQFIKDYAKSKREMQK